MRHPISPHDLNPLKKKLLKPHDYEFDIPGTDASPGWAAGPAGPPASRRPSPDSRAGTAKKSIWATHSTPMNTYKCFVFNPRSSAFIGGHNPFTRSGNSATVSNRTTLIHRLFMSRTLYWIFQDRKSVV